MIYIPSLQIASSRLLLYVCDESIFTAMLESDAALEKLLDIKVEKQWSEFGLEPYAWSKEELKKDPEHWGWLSYLVIHRDDQKMIGTCGYKGKPDKDGMVEIGYGLAIEYRLQGLATEAARALIQYAFEQAKVKKVMAHTLAGENASGSVLKKCGMDFVQEIYDPEDGDIWQWEIVKEPK